MINNNNMAADGAVLAVPAEVLFHDGANWVRLDNSTNGSTGLSTIQLIKTTQQDSLLYRIVAIRNIDNKRIVDQTIFHRLKYKEATPMFHQWRNEHRQVIGLNFPKEQDARHFYSAVRQALEIVINLQQQQYSTSQSAQKSQQIENGTYQDPQQFHQNNYSAYQHHQQQENNIIYATNHENAYNNDGGMMMKMGGGGDYADTMNGGGGQRVMERKGPSIANNINNGHSQFHGSIAQQQQQNLIRRASQGSNISSSTGGSIPGQFPTTILTTNPQINGNSSSENNSIGGNFAPQTPPIQQQNGLPPKQQFPSAIHQQNAPPPPPPPPPPELKSALAGGKQQSFADQLRHVQLKKNNNNGTDSESKSSPSTVNANSHQQQQNGGGIQKGNQDFISELADRLNKRKITNGGVGGPSSTGTNGPVPPPPPPPPNIAPNTSKNATTNVHSTTTNCHKKIPSGTSLSSQEDANANSSNNSIGSRNVIAEQQNGTGTSRLVTTDDLARLKAELATMFAEELNKMKTEMTQIVRTEIAKLITNQK